MDSGEQISFGRAKRLSLERWTRIRNLALSLEVSVAKRFDFCTRWNPPSYGCEHLCEARFLCGGDNAPYEDAVRYVDQIRDAIIKVIDNLKDL